MPIEPSQNVSGPRPVGMIDARIVRTAAGAKDHTTVGNAGGTVAPQAATFQPSAALDPGQAPVDTDRVAIIRHAIETGTYPIVPAKIADAMIAAGLLLRSHA